MSSKNIFLAVAVFALSFAVAKPAFAESCTISSETFGCASKEYYQKLMSIAAQGDKEAFRQGALAGLRSGKCVHFDVGESVYLGETGSIFSDVIQVRRAGQFDGYWLSIKFVNTPPSPSRR